MYKIRPEVANHLGYYVYRLVDSRTNQTFYVGKGCKGRVLHHLRTPAEVEARSRRREKIRQIREDGGSVIVIIHRHGMEEGVAFEVEAALIDVYRDTLTNAISGVGACRGIATLEELTQQYARDEAVFVKEEPVLLIKINRSARHKDYRDAVRFAWPLNKARANQVKYVLAVDNGVIVDAFENCIWIDAKRKDFPEFWSAVDRGKAAFIDGSQVTGDARGRYVGKRVPQSCLNRAPFLYYPRCTG